MKKIPFLLFVVMLSMCGARVSGADEVNFQAADGVKIAGTLNTVPQSKGTVILIHMLARDRKDWNGFSSFLNQNGWSTFSIDLRGHGESRDPGKSIDWKIFKKEDFRKMIEDVAGAIQFLKTKENPLPERLFMIGASIGANLSLEYASQHPEISGVVLLSPGVDYRGIRPKRAAMEYKARPVLFVASEEDTFSVTSSEFLYQLAPTDKKELIKLQEKGHGTQMLEHELKLRDKILEFLTTAQV